MAKRSSKEKRGKIPSLPKLSLPSSESITNPRPVGSTEEKEINDLQSSMFFRKGVCSFSGSQPGESSVVGSGAWEFYASAEVLSPNLVLSSSTLEDISPCPSPTFTNVSPFSPKLRTDTVFPFDSHILSQRRGSPDSPDALIISRVYSRQAPPSPELPLPPGFVRTEHSPSPTKEDSSCGTTGGNFQFQPFLANVLHEKANEEYLSTEAENQQKPHEELDKAMQAGTNVSCKNGETESTEQTNAMVLATYLPKQNGCDDEDHGKASRRAWQNQRSFNIAEDPLLEMYIEKHQRRRGALCEELEKSMCHLKINGARLSLYDLRTELVCIVTVKKLYRSNLVPK